MNAFYIENENGTRALIGFCAIIACVLLKQMIFGEGWWWIQLPVLIGVEWVMIGQIRWLSKKYAVRDSVLALERWSNDERIRDHEIGKRLREITVLARELHELGLKP